MKKLIKKLIPKPVKKWMKDFIGVTAFDHVAIGNDGLQGTIDKLERKYRFYQPILVRFLIGFYRYLQELENDLPQYEGSELLIIHTCCWSSAYADKMKNYYLPSLLAKNNLPKVSETYKVIVLIHCDQATQAELLNSSLADEIKKYASLSFITLPEHIFSIYQGKLNFIEQVMAKKFSFIDNFKYALLGGFQTHAFKIALKNKAYISFMMPDVILSDGFFTEMCVGMENKKIAVNTTFRTNYHKMAEKVKKFYDNSAKTILSIPATILTELQIETIHDSAKRRIVSELTANFSPCAQLLFETKNGFIVRSFHYHPILINCAHITDDIKMDYFPIDNSVLNQMVSTDILFDQQLSICNDRAKLAWVELSDDNIEGNFPIRPAVTRNELVAGMREMITRHPRLYDTPLNRYFFSQRSEVYSSNIKKDGYFIDDYQFSSELQAD